MNKYTKPSVVKVALNPEQAVLGTCSAGTTNLKDTRPFGCERRCKQKKDFKRVDYNSSS